jgi:miniconductance mechanosensitive channel
MNEYIQNWFESLTKWLTDIGIAGNWIEIFQTGIILVSVFILSFIADRLAKKILLVTISNYIKRSKAWWDDIFLQKKFFTRLAHLAPALVIYFSAGLITGHPVIMSVIQAVTIIYMIFIGLLALDSVLNGFHDIYQQLPMSKDRPIKGFIQILKIILYFIGGILILSIVFNKNPGFFLTGLGALAAVLLLVFKDTILGFVASIQLTANNMVRIGDWITMPSHGADGTVTEITLNTVKVQNFDKTISTIPTYALVAESFNNWRGMQESGGRRIKRSFFIDLKSIDFCTSEMLQHYEKINLISGYIKEKIREIEGDNKAKNLDKDDMLNGRRLTNVGVFRKYIELYIRNHPNIHGEGSPFIAMVRQLQPTEKGLPMEIYAFSKEQSWIVYEGIQADIFDHLMAIIPVFGLRLFQNPSGDDFRKAFNAR